MFEEVANIEETKNIVKDKIGIYKDYSKIYDRYMQNKAIT